jgi:ectoine hydroxylase
MVPDSAVRDTGLKRFANSSADVAWLDPAKDVSAASLAEKIDAG